MALILQPYDPAWANDFYRLKEYLYQQCSNSLCSFQIEHVGSTAIPGLMAKPVLDIDIIIEDTACLNTLASKLTFLGYIYKGEQGIEGRFAFRPSSAAVPYASPTRTWPAHHLYVCFADSLALRNHLCFRNALLQDSSLRDQYMACKMTLLNAPEINREKYTILKTDFILSVLKRVGFSNEEIALIRRQNQ